MGPKLCQNSTLRHKYQDLELRGGQEPPGKASEAPESLQEASQDATGSVPDALQQAPRGIERSFRSFAGATLRTKTRWQCTSAPGKLSLLVAVTPWPWRCLPARGSMSLRMAVFPCTWQYWLPCAWPYMPWCQCTCGPGRLELQMAMTPCSSRCRPARRSMSLRMAVLAINTDQCQNTPASGRSWTNSWGAADEPPDDDDSEDDD